MRRSAPNFAITKRALASLSSCHWWGLCQGSEGIWCQMRCAQLARLQPFFSSNKISYFANPSHTLTLLPGVFVCWLDWNSISGNKVLTRSEQFYPHFPFRNELPSAVGVLDCGAKSVRGNKWLDICSLIHNGFTICRGCAFLRLKREVLVIPKASIFGNTQDPEFAQSFQVHTLSITFTMCRVTTQGNQQLPAACTPVWW